MIFEKRALSPGMDHALIESVSRDNAFANWYWHWTDEGKRTARDLGGGIGDAYMLDFHVYEALPDTTQAVNWWHLCSKVGLTEMVARALYRAVTP